MNTETIIKALELFSEKIIDNKKYLSELDTPIGDGDHGGNMVRGVKALQESLAEDEFDSAADVFKTAAKALMGKVGGASGPLYGSAFLQISKALADGDDLLEALEAGRDGITKRGKSSVGDKTMVDVWTPALELLADGDVSTDDLAQLAEDTKELKAKKGRASYLGDRSVGHIDPGAMSSVYFFQALVEAEAVK
ncbi:dihydroxyacetone kinase subunit DhaL [Dolosigranulum pigrum]|uniref:dihydroxyacetone kinase subunit DhaL n=1 Tax=Dolosigranulum pigrum TaxID=29394 RepID=UPI001AD8981B|nr:dihydroxyacetone kinase subunit DhaL [Dolosigranulum pigrum]QTJ34274.1 dihydroxyacetone kinase subunit L [Dolosigranulum pigrum]QTJ39450.1 dihydroxyacetone kinase subunit L [Dolosigranulum pigrum]QTJ47940.1 dihydroxyacetone kinase subunit L [Dolosigranulum pigrum]